MKKIFKKQNPSLASHVPASDRMGSRDSRPLHWDVGVEDWDTAMVQLEVEPNDLGETGKTSFRVE